MRRVREILRLKHECGATDRAIARSLTLADAILDRIIHNAHRLQLKGDSLRKQKAPKPVTA